MYPQRATATESSVKHVIATGQSSRMGSGGLRGSGGTSYLENDDRFMVKAAYSSGHPSLGVGLGNTPAIITNLGRNPVL